MNDISVIIAATKTLFPCNDKNDEISSPNTKTLKILEPRQIAHVTTTSLLTMNRTMWPTASVNHHIRTEPSLVSHRI